MSDKTPFGWQRSERFYASTPMLRNRIRHAWQILTTGKATYSLSLCYKIGENHSLLIDDEALVLIPNPDKEAL